tara:strand:- start:23 stop:190 length:168 start_codon:yes stop_codon:yes gene_type:complete
MKKGLKPTMFGLLMVAVVFVGMYFVIEKNVLLAVTSVVILLILKGIDVSKNITGI